MSSNIKKLRGEIAPYTGEGDSRVVLRDGNIDYRVLPRGAGIDLDDEVGAQVEVDALLREEAEGEFSIQVRTFRILDEDEIW